MKQKYKLSKYIEFLNLSDRNNEDKYLLYAFRTSSLHSICLEYIEHIRNNNFDKLPLNILESFCKYKIIVDINEDENEEILTENILFTKKLKNFGFVIQPSANCQLNCTYCGQEHSNKYMTTETQKNLIKRIKENINKQKNTTSLDVTWYGGEPLLAIDTIRSLTKEIFTICKENKLTYYPMMITNGMLLTKKNIPIIIDECKINTFQITLDGPSVIHDKNRPTKNGKGTFNTILQNIQEVTKNNFFIKSNGRILIRININKNNYKHVDDLINILSKSNIQKYVDLDFAPIVDWGFNGASRDSFTREEFAQLEIKWIIKSNSLGFSYKQLLPKRGPVCMVVNEFAEVYDAHGIITPCYEMNYTKYYADSEHIIGNLNSSNIIGNSPLRKWNLKLIRDYPCFECKYLPLCGGNCPKDWIKKEPACPSFKFNLKDRMLLDFRHTKNN